MVWEFVNNLPSYEPYPAQTRSKMVYTAHRYGMDYAGLKGPVAEPIEREPAPDTGSIVVEEAEEDVGLASIASGEEDSAVKRRLKHLGY